MVSRMHQLNACKVATSTVPVRVPLADLNVIQDRQGIVWLDNVMHAVMDDGLLHRLIVQPVRRRR
jgi:hypothetical protein